MAEVVIVNQPTVVNATDSRGTVHAGAPGVSGSAAPPVVLVDQPTVVNAVDSLGTVYATIPGIPGPPGPPGADGDKHYVYTQAVAASVWTINHPLNKHPSVTVVDSAGDEVEGDVKYVSMSSIVLTFAAPFSGKAYLN